MHAFVNCCSGPSCALCALLSAIVAAVVSGAVLNLHQHAQALTLAVLSGAAVYHYYEKRLGEPSEK
ncbi:unnamed protein product [Camellia sinensis]